MGKERGSIGICCNLFLYVRVERHSPYMMHSFTSRHKEDYVFDSISKIIGHAFAWVESGIVAIYKPSATYVFVFIYDIWLILVKYLPVT